MYKEDKLAKENNKDKNKSKYNIKNYNSLEEER